MKFDESRFKQIAENTNADFEYKYFEDIDSTNDYAKRTDFSFKKSLFAVISGHQTIGHGRFKRPFISPKDKDDRIIFFI